MMETSKSIYDTWSASLGSLRPVIAESRQTAWRKGENMVCQQIRPDLLRGKHIRNPIQEIKELEDFFRYLTASQYLKMINSRQFCFSIPLSVCTGQIMAGPHADQSTAIEPLDNDHKVIHILVKLRGIDVLSSSLPQWKSFIFLSTWIDNQSPIQATYPGCDCGTCGDGQLIADV